MLHHPAIDIPTHLCKRVMSYTRIPSCLNAAIHLPICAVHNKWHIKRLATADLISERHGRYRSIRVIFERQVIWVGFTAIHNWISIPTHDRNTSTGIIAPRNKVRRRGHLRRVVRPGLIWIWIKRKPRRDIIHCFYVILHHLFRRNPRFHTVTFWSPWKPRRVHRQRWNIRVVI